MEETKEVHEQSRDVNDAPRACRVSLNNGKRARGLPACAVSPHALQFGAPAPLDAALSLTLLYLSLMSLSHAPIDSPLPASCPLYILPLSLLPRPVTTHSLFKYNTNTFF